MTTTKMSIEEARQIERAPITVGGRYEFYCTMQQEYEPPEKRMRNYTAQTVTVLAHTNAADEGEDGYEPVYQVRAADGFEFDAFEGELNDWFKDTGQYFWPDATWGPDHETWPQANETER